MEIINLEGYTEYEKIHIAHNFLIPRQLKANGLMAEEVNFDSDALSKIIRDYTREAGVRTLERQIGSIFRKIVVRIAGGEITGQDITPQTVREFLKKEKFEAEISETFEMPGIATGLAVTATGGDILFVEATRMSGKGKLTLTGQLGHVMRESAQIAHSYVRSKARQLNIDPAEFEKTEVHLHVPAGAIPKDGPSAGIAMVTAIASLFSGRPVRGDVGMTGELTLRGRVMAIGGLKMKVLAAHRAGLTTVILPRRNEGDLDDLSDEIRQSMTFVPVDQIDQAIEVVLTPATR
jgi:ATP-dependent Lon protease